MITVKSIADHLESIAPRQLQESYDNSGLLTGNYNMELTGAMISLDCTEDIVDEAIECNANMKRSIGHDSACKASYFAACLPNKFHAIHDDLFRNQDSLTPLWVEEYAKKEGVLDCYKNPKTKDKVVSYIDKASSFNIKSTPTLLVNGVKIEGVLPFPQLAIILDEIIKRATK